VTAGGPAAGRGVRLVTVALAAVLTASFARNIGERGDFQGYLEVGELVLRGADIYAEARPGVNTWPPLFSVLCVPFALLARPSVYLARGVWLVVNAAIVWAILRIVVALVYRRRLALAPAPGALALASTAVLGPLVLSSRVLLGNLDRLQINLLILLCCLAGGLWLARGRPGRAGAVIGLAAAIKVLPVFLLPYLAWKRWWRALAAALATGAVARALPVLVFGPARFWDYVERWLAIARGGWPVRKGNQSLYAMVDRYYTHGVEVVWSPAALTLVASDDPVVAAIVWGALAAVAAVFVALARRGGRDPGSPAVTVELAIVLAVAVLFSPLAWKHYFVFLLPAYAVLWHAAFGLEEGLAWPRAGAGAAAASTAAGVGAGGDAAPALGLPVAARRRLGWMIAASFALTTLTVRGLVGKPVSVAFEAASTTTLGALLVLAALLYLRALLGPGARAG
jgi:hypothetical protein